MSSSKLPVIDSCSGADQIVQDRVAIFLAGLQGEQGFSNGEIAAGVVQALGPWLQNVGGTERKAVLQRLDSMLGTVLENAPKKDLGGFVSGALARESLR